jgi:hypothetical protein
MRQTKDETCDYVTTNSWGFDWIGGDNCAWNKSISAQTSVVLHMGPLETTVPTSV